MRKIISYSDFTSLINEGDGFGTLPFLLRKEGDIYYYFFQLEREKGGQDGYVFLVGKYSR